MLVDANVLLYSANAESPRHSRASSWLSDALNGDQRVGFPLASIWAFVRIATNPRVFARPLSHDEAWGLVSSWVEAEMAWIPEPGPRHLGILRDIMLRHDVRRDLVADAVLAAIAIEHGVPVVSADADFARFTDVSWVNPFVD